jgi:tetratricopeptide (TPR) repeat protein
MRYLFGGGSFFVQKCLRRIGTLNSEGYGALALERYNEALHLFEQAQEEGINYSLRTGILQALSGMGRYQALLDSAATYARDTASYPLLPMLIEEGDAYWALGASTFAREKYDSALALDINQGISLRARLRLIFLSARPEIRTIMRTYFTRPMKVTQRIILLRSAQALADTFDVHLLLKLMEASLIADQLPETAVSTRMEGVLQPVLTIRDSIRPAFTIERVDSLYRIAQWDVKVLLHDADYYSMILHTPRRHWGFPAFAPVGGSSQYRNERMEESDRFRHYLRVHRRSIYR